MKNILIILISTLVLISCGDEKTQSVEEILASGNLPALKAKKEQVIKSYDSIGSIIGQLDLAISQLDTLKKLPLVTTIVLQDTLFNNFIDIQGNVATNENILIYPEYQGILTQVYVKKGTKVSKGQLLAKIDDGGLSNQLSQLETQYELAKTTFERQERLWNQKIGSEIQYLQAKSNMEAAKNGVDQVRSQVARTTVRAPFSGEIDEIITDQGQVVGPGSQALMRIVNLTNMYVKASIPENYLSSIIKGSDVNVSFPAINKDVSGKIRTVGNFINPSNRTFEIEIDVPNLDQAIKPNLVAKLEINNYSNENAQLIPANIIQENSEGEKFVFVINDPQGNEAFVTRTKIETGLKYKGQVEVVSGLTDGQILVAAGALTLTDGARVKIKESN